MTKQKYWLQWFPWMLVAMSFVLSPAGMAAQTGAPARRPSVGQKAGNISALLPVAKITRGAGQNKTVTPASKGDEVAWNDLIQTEKGGRARILLNDQSVISLGSQAELRILKHDSRSQQTQMQLEYGRVRMQVAAITRDAGRFELRTPTAVAGVIGTEFGTDSSLPGVTDFICITGIVTVANEDTRVPGSVQCPAGSTTTVNKGMAPTPPKPATQQQIRQLIQDTEPAVISSFSPASAILGTEVISAVTGSKMLGINAVSISGEGVTVALEGAPTDTTTNVKVAVSGNAPAGTRTIIFTKANGQTTSAVFSILAPPATGGTVDYAALKQAYLTLIDEERQSAISGVHAIGINVQQSADATNQAISTENTKLAPPLDPAKIDADLKADTDPVLQAMNAAGAGINEESAKAGKDLETGIDAVQRRLAAAQPAPSEDEKAKAAKEVFDRINAQLLQRFNSLQEGVAGAAKSADTRFQATLQRWTEAVKLEAVKQRAVPLPKVDADERSYDVGLMATFDASRSTGAAGSAITGYSWVLCDPGYKPQQVGIPLPPSDTRCRPVAGYAGTSPEFKFPTCMLNPQDYIARVSIVDASNKSAAMDVRVRVLPAQYEEPGGRLRSLADAYMQLQPNTFSTFFDESYSGLTELQESIRRTFASLASMNINLRLSQASLGCNEATVRADWDQNYTFKEDQTCVGAPLGENCQRVVFHQSEQLTVRMKRIPGKNWYITDFQGNNGTVQGTPPGPIQRDTALPDFRISNLGALSGTVSTTSSAIGITPGPNSFTAIVENVGTAASQGQIRVRFAANDANGTEIASDLREFTGSLASGGSTSISGTLNIPDLGPTANARIFANVNPGCTVTEKNCDGANVTLLDVIVGNVDIALVSASQVGTLIGTQPGVVEVVVNNAGSRSSAASFGNLRVLSGTLVIGTASIPALAPGASVTIPVSIVAPNPTVAGSSAVPVTISINPAAVADLNPANDTLAASLTVSKALVDVKVTGLAFSGSTPPYLSGQTVTVTANVANTGNRPTSSVSFSCTLSGVAGSSTSTSQSVPIIVAGGTITGFTHSFVVPANFAGNDILTCQATVDPFEVPPASTTDNVSLPLAMQVNINVDLQAVNLPAANTPLQMGSTVTYTFGIQNLGADTVPATTGWNVILNVDGSPVGAPFVSTTALAGFTTVPVSITFTVPGPPTPAPTDISGVPVLVQVINTNPAATETNTANNTTPGTVRLVDFTLTTIAPVASPLTSVTSRTFNATVIQVLPTTYPAALPITMNYTGLPAGLAAAGTNGVNVSGTVTAAAGSYPVNASGTSAGVSRSASSSFGINVLNEITVTPGTPPSLTAASGGGPAQPATASIAGGIYPVALSFVSPTGIAISGPTTQGAAGVASYSLSADPTATAGAQSFVLTVTDPGNTNTPGKVVTANIPYSVIGFVDLAIQPFAITPAGPYLSGQSIAVNLTVDNLGNAFTSAANTYSCQHNGTPGVLAITSGALPVIAPNSSVTIPVNFVMPPNRAPLSLFECTVSQDPQESGAALNDNFRSVNLTINQNVDLEVISVNAAGAYQMGGSAVVNLTVRNNGLDTAGSGWDVGVKINGATVGTPGIGGALAGGASVNFNPTVPLPQIGTAPTNSANYTLQGFANANAAITETTSANNTLSSTINLVDFRLVQVSSGGTAVVGRFMSLTPAVQVDPASYPLPLMVNFTGSPAGLAGAGSPYGQDVSGTPTTPGSATITADATVSGVLRTMPGNIPLTINNEINLVLGATFNPLVSGGAAETLQVNVTGGIYPVTVTLPLLPAGITTTSPTSVVLGAPGSATWNLQAGLNSTPGAFNLLISATDEGSTATNTATGSASLNVPGSVNGQSNYVLTNAAWAAPHSTGIGADALQTGETAVLGFTAQNSGNLSQTGTLNVTVTLCNGSFSATAAAPAAGSSVNGAINVPVNGCGPGIYSYTVAITAAPPETTTADNNIGPVTYQVYAFAVSISGSLSPQNIKMGTTGTFLLSFAESVFGPPLILPLTISNGGKATTNPTGTFLTPSGAFTISVTNSGSAVSGDTETVVGSITRFGITSSASQPVKFYTAQVDNISAGQPGSTAGNPLVLAIGQSATSVDFKLIGTFAGSATFNLPVATGYNITLSAGAPSLPNDIFTLSVAAVAGAPSTVVAVPIVFNIPNTNPAQTVSTTLFVRAFAPSNLAVGTPVGTGTRFGARNFSTYPLLSGEPGDLSVPVSNTGLGASTAGLTIQVRLGSASGPVISTGATVPSIPAGSTANVVVHVRAPEPVATGSTLFYVEVAQDPIEFDASNNNNSLAITASDWTLTITGPGDPGSPLEVTLPSPGSATTAVSVVPATGSVFAPIALSAIVPAESLTIEAPPTITTSAAITVVATNPGGDLQFSQAYQIPLSATMLDGATPGAVRIAELHVLVTSGGVTGPGRDSSSLPDLQVKATDVSISPSIPRPGDALDVRFKVTNAGAGDAVNVPISLQINGVTVATDSISLKAGASTLGGFQYALPRARGADGVVMRKLREKQSDLEPYDPPTDTAGISAQLVIDPARTVAQASSANKSVMLTRSGLTAAGGIAAPVERVYLEMTTICAGFRPSSGVIGDCEGGAELDIAIEDFANSRYSLTALYGVADLGAVDITAASTSGIRFEARAQLTLGHTYAVQLSGNRVGFVRFSASLTPRQLEAEARKRFGAAAIRILRRLGSDTGATQVGDVSGRISADALMYFDMSFRMPQ